MSSCHAPRRDGHGRSDLFQPEVDGPKASAQHCTTMIFSAVPESQLYELQVDYESRDKFARLLASLASSRALLNSAIESALSASQYAIIKQ